MIIIILHSTITSSLFEKIDQLLATRDVHMTVWRNVSRDKCSCNSVGSLDYNFDLEYNYTCSCMKSAHTHTQFCCVTLALPST